MTSSLAPLSERFGVNYVTGAGYMSISSIRRLLERARSTGKLVRILYASDFDPAGKQMPVTPARRVEYALREMEEEAGEELDIKLDPVILTEEQVYDNELGDLYSPDEEEESKVELDALEAKRPGKLEEIFTEKIRSLRDNELGGKLRRAKREAQKLVNEKVAEVRRQHREKLEEIEETVEAIAERCEETLEALAEEVEAEIAPHQRFVVPPARITNFSRGSPATCSAGTASGKASLGLGAFKKAFTHSHEARVNLTARRCRQRSLCTPCRSINRPRKGAAQTGDREPSN